MTTYYFFKIEREHNASHEYRTVVHPLPGQFTYVNQSHRHEPVDPTLKVQLPNAQNGKACRCSCGDVIGVKLTSDNPHYTKLGLYKRNETKFYRTEGEIYLVHGIGCHNLQQADDAMMEAYHTLQANTVSAAQASPREQAPIETQPCGASLAPRVPTHINTRELSTIEDSLLEDLDEREALNKTLIISQIRDRTYIGVSKFCYVKQNGEIRVAYGTRNPEVIRLLNGNEQPDNGHSNEPDGAHFNYFDVQRHAWRRFCTSDIKSVQADILITNIGAIRSLAATNV